MTTYKPTNSPYYHFDFQFRGERYYGSTGCTGKRAADQFEARSGNAQPCQRQSAHRSPWTRRRVFIRNTLRRCRAGRQSNT